jgi:hypothetical protein
MIEVKHNQTSATYVANLVKSLDQLGRKAEVLAVAAPPTVVMINRPTSKSWWDHADVVELTAAIVKVGGPELVREIAKKAVVESTSRILKPFIAVLTAMGKTSPRQYFERWPDITAVSVRNVKFEWTSKGPGQGTLVATYPQPVPETFAQYWFGGFDVVFEQTRRIGTVTLEPSTSPAVFVFSLSWRK